MHGSRRRPSNAQGVTGLDRRRVAAPDTTDWSCALRRRDMNGGDHLAVAPRHRCGPAVPPVETMLRVAGSHRCYLSKHSITLLNRPDNSAERWRSRL